MKKTFIRSEERRLTELIQRAVETTNCFKFWLYIDSSQENHDFLVTEENSKTFSLCTLQRKDLLKAINDLEKRDWIYIKKEPDLKGIFTLFINFLPHYASHNHTKA